MDVLNLKRPEAFWMPPGRQGACPHDRPVPSLSWPLETKDALWKYCLVVHFYCCLLTPVDWALSMYFDYILTNSCCVVRKCFLLFVVFPLILLTGRGVPGMPFHAGLPTPSPAHSHWRPMPWEIAYLSPGFLVTLSGLKAAATAHRQRKFGSERPVRT